MASKLASDEVAIADLNDRQKSDFLFLEMLQTRVEDNIEQTAKKYQFDFENNAPILHGQIQWSRTSNSIPYQAEDMQVRHELKPRLTLKQFKFERLSDIQCAKGSGFGQNERFSIFSNNMTASTCFDSTFSKSSLSQFGATLNDKSQKFSIASLTNNSVFDFSQNQARLCSLLSDGVRPSDLNDREEKE